jgi:hypothetical protein
MLSYLLNKYQGAGLQSHKLREHLTLYEAEKLFSKGLDHFAHPTATVGQ